MVEECREVISFIVVDMKHVNNLSIVKTYNYPYVLLLLSTCDYTINGLYKNYRCGFSEKKNVELKNVLYILFTHQKRFSKIMDGIDNFG